MDATWYFRCPVCGAQRGGFDGPAETRRAWDAHVPACGPSPDEAEACDDDSRTDDEARDAVA